MEEVNNEVNEMALTELVTGTLEESDFDYSGVSEEEKDELIKIKLRKGVIIHATIVEIGSDLVKAQKIYAKYGNGKFNKWVVEEYGMALRTAYQYIHYYEVLSQQKLLHPDARTENQLETLGLNKVDSLYKLQPEQRQQIMDDVSTNELNRKEFNNLIKKVKEAGEYSDELLEQIKQKDKKLQEQEENQSQKDQEIADLKAKLQKLENEKVQPVAQVEPEVVEKIVEVEKVVEKEVVPEKIKQELETYKKLAQEKQNEIPEYVLNELYTLRETVKEQDQQLNDAKRTVEAIATQTNSKFGTQNIDWGLLGNVVNSFLSKASEYTYMKDAFKKEDGKSKNFVRNQVDNIEKWVIEMKRMMNDVPTIENTFYVEADNVEVIKEDENNEF